MKEYILVILSGICKAVEKTKWPEEPKIIDRIPEEGQRPFVVAGAMEEYERQKREAFEGGALVDLDVLNEMDWEFKDKILSKPDFKLIDGAYPIDPSILEVVEQWQYKTINGEYWMNCSDSLICVLGDDHETRLTATIKPIDEITKKANDVERVAFENLKPKENSAHGYTEGADVPEPTIATDSTTHTEQTLPLLNSDPPFNPIINQAEELSAKIQGQKSTIETFRELNKTLMDDIVNVKTELQELRLALITRDGNLTSKILKEENDQLKAELSRKEERLKAADYVVKLLEFVNGFDCTNATIEQLTKARETYKTLTNGD